MSSLQPQINGITPAEPIVITIDPATQLGRSGILQLSYTVTDAAWVDGQASIDFKALLQALNTPYHVVGGTPTVDKDDTLRQNPQNFTFNFVLEITVPIVGGAFPVRLQLSVFDKADPVQIQRSNVHSFSVTLQ